MNLDLLIKLAKLANNNPNENEANAAARKVCKLIEENGYSFTSITNNTFQDGGYSININDIMRDFRRATGQPYNPYAKTGYNPFTGNFTVSCSNCGNPTMVNDKTYDSNKPTLCSKCAKKQEDARKARPESTYNPRTDTHTYTCKKCGTKNELTSYHTLIITVVTCDGCGALINLNQGPDTKERHLKCSKCGQRKTTTYVGQEFMFVCQDCEWR